MSFYTDTNKFSKELIDTYITIIDIIRFGGDNGIVNKKRQEAFKRAITIIETNEKYSDINCYIKELAKILTDKTCKIMKELFKTGKVNLESKEPYNGACIINGKLLKEEKNESFNNFQNLNRLIGIGIGIGDSAIKELATMGYTDIDQLKTIYEKDKFKTFRKGLQVPLCKYFEGTVRIEKMPRSEATKWKETIDETIDDVINDLKYNNSKSELELEYKIAGSYARKNEEIGDIDYVIVGKDDNILYTSMNNILDKLTEIEQIGKENESIKVILDSVVETPSKSRKEKRYTTSIKLWFKMENGLKTKIEIYGYTSCNFCFPYYARSCDVDLQKKIKILALKKGMRLGPWGLVNKDTGEDEEINVNIKTIRQLYDFLEYKIKSNKNDY